MLDLPFAHGAAQARRQIKIAFDFCSGNGAWTAQNDTVHTQEILVGL
jgi:hypothetical protein